MGCVQCTMPLYEVGLWNAVTPIPLTARKFVQQKRHDVETNMAPMGLFCFTNRMLRLC